MKKGLLVTTMVACSALLLASCAKQVSYEEAKKHCDDNYTSTELKLFNVHSKEDVKKATGTFASMYEVGVTEEDEEEKCGVLESADLAIYGGEKAVYKVDGKKLSIELSLSCADYLKEMGIEIAEGDKAEGSVEMKVSVDDQGYPLSYWAKTDVDYSITYMGVTVAGALTVEESASYSAK